MREQPDKIEFSMDKGLELPNDIVLHRFGDRHLYIAPEKGMWLTVNNISTNLVQSLRDGSSLSKAIENIMRNFHLSEKHATSELKSLLRQIAIKQFYEATVPEQNITTEAAMDFNLHLHLTQKCNLRCKHCYMDSGVAYPEELSIAEWKDIIDQFVEMGGRSVTFSGGEPLMFSGFYKLADYVRQKNLKTLLITNGILISNASIAESLSTLITKIRISVDGCTPRANDQMRGKGTFAKVNSAIELLEKTGNKIETAITIYPENQGDVVENLKSYLNTL